MQRVAPGYSGPGGRRMSWVLVAEPGQDGQTADEQLDAIITLVKATPAGGMPLETPDGVVLGLALFIMPVYGGLPAGAGLVDGSTAAAIAWLDDVDPDAVVAGCELLATPSQLLAVPVGDLVKDGGATLTTQGLGSPLSVGGPGTCPSCGGPLAEDDEECSGCGFRNPDVDGRDTPGALITSRLGLFKWRRR